MASLRNVERRTNQGSDVGFGDELTAQARATIGGRIMVREGTTVPTTKQVLLEKNEGVEIDATYLYADMVGSSDLAQTAYKPVTAKIIRSYINGASKILERYGGEIRSFDGDRVMAIFVGPDKETFAVRAGLAINWLVQQVLRPMVKDAWTDIAASWQMDHSVGIDTGRALITRGGVRGDNDLISIGRAPNVAAKLSDIRSPLYKVHITHEVYEPMSNAVAFHEGRQMWSREPILKVGGRAVQVLGTTYWWEP